MEADHVLLYDADCGFCRWSLDKILSRDRDRRVRILPLQSSEADTLLGGMSHEKKMASWHLVTPEGKVYSAGDAVAPLMRLIRGGKPVAAIAKAAPGPTRAAYRLVARNREKFGRLLGEQACSVDPQRR